MMWRGGGGINPSSPSLGPGPIDVVLVHHGLLRVATVVRQVPIQGARDILVLPRKPRKRSGSRQTRAWPLDALMFVLLLAL